MLSSVRGRRFINKLFVVLATFAFFLALVPLLSILYQTIAKGYGALNLDFFTQITPPIGGSGGGIINAIEGSLVCVGIASVIGIPIGLFSGAYLYEYPGRIANSLRLVAEVLTGVPSIVTGIVVYVVIVATFHRFSAIAGGVALSFMMIPIVAISTHESLKLVPTSIKEGGLALGVSRSKTLLYILVSTAKSGIVTGIALSVARIMGETAPLLFTALGNQFLMNSIFDPAESMTVLIYDYGTSPYPVAHAFAWGAALILLLIVLGLNVVVRVASRLKPTVAI
jgi:phosphate transport system permease protein